MPPHNVRLAALLAAGGLACAHPVLAAPAPSFQDLLAQSAQAPRRAESPAQIAAARAEVNRLLDVCPVDLSGIRTFIGVAGTITSMAAVNLGLASYDRTRVHGSVMTTFEVTEMADRLLNMSAAEIAVLGPVAPERAKVLAAGALVVAEVTRRVKVNLQASEADILDGIAWSIVGAGKGQRLPG